MNWRSQVMPCATVCLLTLLSLSACTSRSGSASYVKFFVQMGTFVPEMVTFPTVPPIPNRVLVSMQNATGACTQTYIVLSHLKEVIDHPADIRNQTTRDHLISCSSLWILPQPPNERTREYIVFGPNNGKFTAHLIANDESTGSTNPNRRNPSVDVDNVVIETSFPQGQLGIPVHDDAATTELRSGTNTFMTTAPPTSFPGKVFSRLSFTPTVLDFNANPPRGAGKFQFLAANKDDGSDTRLLIALDGIFEIQPDRR